MDYGSMREGLNVDNYQEYIEKVVNIFRLSSKDSSILFNLKIDDDKVNIHLSIIEKKGDKKDFNDIVFQYDSSFFSDFLETLVEMIARSIDITTKDIVNLDKDELVAFRMVTINNDLFTIDGLNEDDANSLLKIANKE